MTRTKTVQGYIYREDAKRGALSRAEVTVGMTSDKQMKSVSFSCGKRQIGIPLDCVIEMLKGLEG